MTSSLTDRTPTRRQALATLAVLAAGGALAACSQSNAASSTAGATTSGTSGTTTTSSGTTSSTTTTASATGTAAAGSVVALAQAFQATLSSSLQATLVQTYGLANAARWSNLPQALVRGSGARVGVNLGQLTEAQIAAMNSLLQAATGTATGNGWDELVQELNADDYLATKGGGSTYGRANYYIAFLGQPTASGTWELQFGGHHFALANTYVNGQLAGATPSFRGVEPNGAFTQGGRSNEPLAVKEKAFAALLAGLSADQLAKAKLSSTFSDLLLGPGKDWAFPTTRDGVQVSTLSDAQKTLVKTAIASYVNDIADADAATILARYTSELDQTYVAYSGTTALTQRNDYVRVDGPSVWIEFSMQGGIVLSGNHPHSVWRDRTTDYGGTKS